MKLLILLTLFGISQVYGYCWKNIEDFRYSDLDSTICSGLVFISGQLDIFKAKIRVGHYKGPDHSGARFDSFGAFLADFWGFQIFPFGPPHETMKIKVV